MRTRLSFLQVLMGRRSENKCVVVMKGDFGALNNTLQRSHLLLVPRMDCLGNYSRSSRAPSATQEIMRNGKNVSVSMF